MRPAAAVCEREFLARGRGIGYTVGDALRQRSPTQPATMNRLGSFLRAALQWCLQFPLGRSQWVTLGIWLVAIAAVMLTLGGSIAQNTNRDPELYDQGAYLRVAEQNRTALWPTQTDGIRNPLFPWLLAKTASGDQSAMFAAGLKLNVRCGAVLVLLLGVWAGRRLAWLPAVTFATLGGIGVLLPISTYVGTEVLFYGLFFAAWMLALDLIEKLTLTRCALFGATLGFAYLAKPGVTLLASAFVAVGLVRWLRKGEDWTGAKPLIGAALALAVAVPMMLPRMLDAARQFGDPLQNTAANCFWEENWDACYPKLSELNPKNIGRLPLDERPSASRYFARHGIGDAWARLSTGMGEQLANVVSADPKGIWFSRSPSPKRQVRRVFPYRGLFLLPPLLLAGGLGVVALRRSGTAAVGGEVWLQIAFAVLLVGASFSAFSWYWVIAPGARFIMALYLPVMASLLIVAEAARRRLATAWADATCAGTWATMLAIFLVHIGIIATHPFFEKVRGAF